MPKRSPADAATLREAAADLDATWMAAAELGLRDSIGGAEYARVSTAPRLRQMADKLDPPLGELLHEFGIDTFFLAERVIGCPVERLADRLNGGPPLDGGAEDKLNIVNDTLRLARIEAAS